MYSIFSIATMFKITFIVGDAFKTEEAIYLNQMQHEPEITTTNVHV